MFNFFNKSKEAASPIEAESVKVKYLNIINNEFRMETKDGHTLSFKPVYDPDKKAWYLKA